jgi:hypothetical protein
MSGDFHIEPLTANEVGYCVDCRLQVAGRAVCLSHEPAIARIQSVMAGEKRTPL